MRIYAVDGNYYLHRVFHTRPEGVKDPSLHLCRMFVSMVCREAIAVKATRLLIAFDGHRVFRHKIDPGYKASRSGSNVYDYLQPLLDYLAALGVPVVQRAQYEADDVLASVAEAGVANGHDVVIGTRDKDSFQYLRKGVRLYDSVAKARGKPAPRYITHGDVPQFIGVRADQALDYQTLVGDSVDDIPSLVSKDKTKKGLAKHGTLKAWIAADSELRTHLRDQRSRLAINRKLVRLVRTIEVAVPPIQWKTGTGAPDAYLALKEYCNPKSRGLF